MERNAQKNNWERPFGIKNIRDKRSTRIKKLNFLWDLGGDVCFVY